MKLNMMMFKHSLAPGQGKAMGIALWSVQCILATCFGMAGYLKTTLSPGVLALSMPWTEDVSLALVRFIGVSEMLGAIGVLMPSITRRHTDLTPAAAMGLLAIMVLAFFFHLSRGEYVALPVPMVLGGLAAFVAWGRGLHSPIQDKGMTG